MSTTTLCFDFGNTRLKCGVFSGNQLTEVFAVKNLNDDTVNAILKKYEPHKTILSSVIDHNVSFEDILSKKSLFHKLSAQSIVPFTTPVSKHDTIGADRLALIAAAVHFYKNKNNLIVALGSCITYNFVTKYHSFLGGSISPGMAMRFRSLKDYTDKLPLVEADYNFPLTGYDTRTNILSGVLFGLAAEIDAFIDAYEKKYSNFNVLLTGGDSLYFAHLLKNKIFADPDLIFKGLYAISEINHDTKT